MATGVNSFSTLGIKIFYWATKNGVYPNGTTTTPLSAGSGAGMGRLSGVSGLSVTEPDSPIITASANNGVLVQFVGEPQELPSGTLTQQSLDQQFAAVATGVKLHTEGDYEYLPGFPACFNYADLFFVINAPAKSTEPATFGQSGWEVTEYFLVNAQAKSGGDKQTNTISEIASPLTLNRVGVLPSGVTITDSAYGTTQMAKRVYWAEYPITYHVFIGNGTATTVTLNETPAAANGNRVQVWNNGTALVYTTDFTVNVTTKVLTFASAPASNAVQVIRYAHEATC
jgi:hypothetical protein